MCVCVCAVVLVLWQHGDCIYFAWCRGVHVYAGVFFVVCSDDVIVLCSGLLLFLCSLLCAHGAAVAAKPKRSCPVWARISRRSQCPRPLLVQTL